MKFVYNDGGREAAGFTGKAGDCVVRAIAIATELPYKQAYNDLMDANKEFAFTHRSSVAVAIGRTGASPRNGVFKEVFKPYIENVLGWTWMPTMFIGSGCKVHLTDGELPDGRLIVRINKHLTAVIDGVIYDTHDPQRHTVIWENVGKRNAGRCVYGYWYKGPT